MIKKVLSVILIILCSMFIMSCSRIDAFKVKVGLKNNDFENIKQGNVKKIVIQNTRDKGFRFIVTDKNAIYDLYDILSSAKEVEEKSSLQPDYIFEMYDKSDNIIKFNYIAGLDRSDNGNFYNDDKVYIVSSRLDNDIIRNFWNIRKPKDFKKVYYNCILNVLNKSLKENSEFNKITIDIEDDLDVAKFILSTDLFDFEKTLKEDYKNISLLKDDKDEDNPTVMKIKTEGYKSMVYKSSVIFKNNNEDDEKKYYVWSKYDKNNKVWNIEVFENSKPEGF